jgi:two-component system phosphate regulon sensor histidine kinase PhoR
VNTDTRNLQAARSLQWLFLVVAAAALAIGGSFARKWPYAIVIAAGAVLNAASYLLPVKGASERRMTAFLMGQVVASITIIALAAGFSGGIASPLFAFLLVVLVLPAATCGIYVVASVSAYAVLAFVLAGVLLGNPFGGAGPAFIKIALLAVFPAGLNFLLSTYRRRLRDRETFSTLYRISRSLGQTLDLRQVLQRLLSEMDAVFSTDISSVRVLDPATNSLVVEASGADAEEVAHEQIAIRLGEGFIGSVAKTGEPFITTDISKDPRFATFPGARKKVASAIAAPIQIGEKTVGVISCASSTRRRFTKDDLELLVSVASLAAAAIERAELYQQLLSRGEAVIESMLDGLVVVDRDCRVVMTNRTSREMLGARPGMGEPLERLLKGKVAEWRRLCRDIVGRIIECPDGVPASFSLDLKVTAAVGEERVLRARVSPVTSQWTQVVGAVLLLEDVTDLIRLTGELAVEKAKLETVLENVVVGVLAVSSTGEVLIANSTMFNILAMARPWWWLGASLEDVIPERALVRFIRNAIDDDRPIFNETIVLSSGRHLEASCVPIKELAAGKAGNVVVLHDVTGLHQAEQARNDFVSMVSHELRTPLTSIKAYVDTLQREDVEFDEETRASFISVISRETERMTRLINDILDLSRIEAGRLDLRPTFVDLPELIRRVVSRTESQAVGHRIVLDLPSEMGPVLAEQAKLEQVMLNLIGNAIKYSPEGGDIEIAVRRLKEKSMVSVSDHGIGISQEQLPYIFDKYHRASLGSGGGIRGAGLGLFVTKSIVEAHGGRIWAESTEGAGTTVIFTVPLATPGGQATEAGAIGGEGA